MDHLNHLMEVLDSTRWWLQHSTTETSMLNNVKNTVCIFGLKSFLLPGGGYSTAQVGYINMMFQNNNQKLTSANFARQQLQTTIIGPRYKQLMATRFSMRLLQEAAVMRWSRQYRDRAILHVTPSTRSAQKMIAASVAPTTDRSTSTDIWWDVCLSTTSISSSLISTSHTPTLILVSFYAYNVPYDKSCMRIGYTYWFCSSN